MTKLRMCTEMCPECGAEIEIPVVGGKCPECGHWAKPCGICSWRGADCNVCPFKEGDTVTGYLEKVLEKVNESIRDLAGVNILYVRATDGPLDNKVDNAVRELRRLRDSIEEEMPTSKVMIYRTARYKKQIDVPAEVALGGEDAIREWLADHE